MSPEKFQAALLNWFDIHGRKDLPWQKDISPYTVWVSEIMLQQTQVATVIPYFQKFMDKFPTVADLAKADLDDVLHSWSGLGYYARARNLHKAAGLINEQNFPETLEGLMLLPGIGQSTAGAILAIACHQSQPILDGNVKRVFARFKAIEGWPGLSQVNKALWAASSHYTPDYRTRDYTQAIMDLGATVCTRKTPSCHTCPVIQGCNARKLEKINNLPTPKPRQKIPEKKCIFLVLTNAKNEIFLEKRAPTGIWGGLWSLPEFEDIKAAKMWYQNKFILASKPKTINSGRHTFSHYHLDYQAILIKIKSPEACIAESGSTVWYKANSTDEIGLPAPIKKLINQTFINEENNA